MWYGTVMKLLSCVCAIFVLAGCKDPAFIPGTGRLPDCDEPPVANLNGTVWFNLGPVTVLTAGCLDVQPDTMLDSCPENWAFTQDGNDIDIVVDEYRVKGRFCGDQLYLEGGWWLSVADERGSCWYEDEDGDEFGIQAGGNVLTYTASNPENGGLAELTGVLLLEGDCIVSYDATFQQTRYPPSTMSSGAHSGSLQTSANAE
jgi:hypothetical protein